jgi:hypothetical protein
MELQRFVTNVLTQIMCGIQKAQQTVGQQGGEVNPPVTRLSSGSAERFISVSRNKQQIVEFVEFDVAVTITEGDETRSAISIMASRIAGSTTDNQSTVSRIRFKVPVCFPG